MLCTFCRTDNRPENKFCGMCGVRLERRKEERRTHVVALKCRSCDSMNEAGYKFCAMCGTRTDRRNKERRINWVERPRAVTACGSEAPAATTAVSAKSAAQVAPPAARLVMPPEIAPQLEAFAAAYRETPAVDVPMVMEMNAE